MPTKIYTSTNPIPSPSPHPKFLVVLATTFSKGFCFFLALQKHLGSQS